MSRRGVLIGALAGGLLVLAGLSSGQGTVFANMDWCSSDPPIQVVTPGGAHLTVNNTIYFHPVDRPNLKLITHDASTAPDGAGATLITVNLYFPDNFSDAYVVSANKRFNVQDTASTNGGATGNNVVTLQLHVPIA
jgi:hypothetical protein